MAACLEVHLHQCELTNLTVLVRVLYLVVGGHARVFSRYVHGLGRVDGDVYNLSGDAETVELRIVGFVAGEAEFAVFIEFYRV